MHDRPCSCPHREPHRQVRQAWSSRRRAVMVLSQWRSWRSWSEIRSRADHPVRVSCSSIQAFASAGSMPRARAISVERSWRACPRKSSARGSSPAGVGAASQSSIVGSPLWSRCGQRGRSQTAPNFGLLHGSHTGDVCPSRRVPSVPTSTARPWFKGARGRLRNVTSQSSAHSVGVSRRTLVLGLCSSAS
jgi:hypothetical protein